MDVLILFAIGAVAGTFAGLLGVGGGIIVVPALIFVFESQGVNSGVLMHVAIGTSLATIVITSLSSIRSHQQHGAILWPVFKRITPGILIGGLLGSFIAKFISGENLKIIFGIFLLLVAAQMIVGMTAKPSRDLPQRFGMWMAGTIIGSLASLMGVGGGTMSVPFMTWCNVAIHNAVATSAAIGFPIAIAGVTGFIIAGLGVEYRPVYSVGYISLPAFISIVVASIMFAPIGARMAHRISAQRLKTIFGYFLLMVGVRILY